MCRYEELYSLKNIYYAIYLAEFSFSHILFLSEQETDGVLLSFEVERKEIGSGKGFSEEKKSV